MTSHKFHINVLIFSIPLLLAAEQNEMWRSELYPQDWLPPVHTNFETNKLIQDFSYAGYHYGAVKLPEPYKPIFDAVARFHADPTGKRDSTSAIQRAIDAAEKAGGGVVFLPEGIYRIHPDEKESSCLTINSPKIILRGAGVDRTRLLNTERVMRNKSIIQVSSTVFGWELPSKRIKGAKRGTTPLSRDVTTPTRLIHVESTEDFATGDWVVLRADATEEFIEEHNSTEYWSGHNRALGGVRFLRQLKAVHPEVSAVEIDIPVRYYLKIRDQARMHQAPPLLEEVGLEDFSIANLENTQKDGWGEPDYKNDVSGSYEVHGCYAIRFINVRNAWARRIKSWHPEENKTKTHILANGIRCDWSRSITIEGCDFQWPQYGGGGGNGYMYRLNNSQEILVQRSAARNMRHGFDIANMSSSGNVLHECETQNTGYQGGGDGRTAGKGSDHHMFLSQSSLIDNCIADRDWFEARHRGTAGGIAHAQTSVHCVFWNTCGRSYEEKVRYIVRSQQARYGYVIGTRGDVYEVNIKSGAITAPIDHIEGIGKGDTLEPQSLYLDQLKRRVSKDFNEPPVVEISKPERVVFGVNKVAAKLHAAVIDDGRPTGKTDVSWDLLESPQPAQFKVISPTSALLGYVFPGEYLIKVIATDGALSNSVTRTVVIE
jgi:hypothetical protein